MKVRIEITEEEIRAAIAVHAANMLGMPNIRDCKLIIEVKTKQNFKSEWEEASIRGILMK